MKSLLEQIGLGDLWMKAHYVDIGIVNIIRQQFRILNYKAQEKNNGFPFLHILGYLKNTQKNPKFGKVRQIPTREFPTKFPNWDLSRFAKFGIFMGML